MYNTSQKLIAEFLGTFALIFFGAGSICADQYLHGAGGFGLLGIALAHGLAIGHVKTLDKLATLGYVAAAVEPPAQSTTPGATPRANPKDMIAVFNRLRSEMENVE